MELQQSATVFNNLSIPLKVLLGIVFLLSIYFVVFYQLDCIGLYRWDESGNALNALEMKDSGNYLRRYFFGKPDNWETKPPLLIWFQVLFLKLLGNNELAIRLPSAFAVLGTVVILFRFFWKEIKNPLGGAVVCLTLLSSAGYVRDHVARTGDHEAMLIFFMTALFLAYYKYLKYPEKEYRYGFIFCISLIGAVMTKSIAGFLFLPGLLIYTIVQRQLFDVLKRKSFYMMVVGFLVAVGGYYLLVEQAYPGYLETVWGNELFPRYFNTSKTIDEFIVPKSKWKYVKLIISDHFVPFVFLLPIAIVLVYISKSTVIKRLTTLSLCVSITFMLIISNGVSNSWYDAPVFPILAILIGCGSICLLDFLFTVPAFKQNTYKYVITTLFLCTLLVFPYYKIITEKVYFPPYFDNEMKYGDFMYKVKEQHPEIKDYYVYSENINRHFIFYHNVFNMDYGYKIDNCADVKFKRCFTEDKQLPAIGRHVLICNQSMQKRIKKYITLEKVMASHGCELYKVAGYPQQPNSSNGTK